MLNYMKSEMYRVIRDKRFWLMILVFAILLPSYVVVLVVFQNYTPNFPYGNTKYALSCIYASMILFFLVAGGFIMILADGDKKHVYKNSIVFGIRRSHVLVGRFVVQAVLASITFLILATLYAVLCYLFLTHSEVGEFSIYWKAIASSSLGLLAVLAGAYVFIMIKENVSSAVAFFGITVWIIPMMLGLLGRRIALFNVIAKAFPYTAIAEYSNHTLQFDVTTGDTVLSLVTGACWLIAFLIFGIISFNRQEIK